MEFNPMDGFTDDELNAFAEADVIASSHSTKDLIISLLANQLVAYRELVAEGLPIAVDALEYDMLLEENQEMIKVLERIEFLAEVYIENIDSSDQRLAMEILDELQYE